jgi:hypothetical protein
MQELSRNDRLAIAYLTGSEAEKAKIQERIKKIAPNPVAKGLTILVILGMFGVLFVLNDAAMQMADRGVGPSFWAVVTFNLLGIAGILKIYFLYLIGRPSIYELLARFHERHPDSPYWKEEVIEEAKWSRYPLPKSDKPH